jgi:GNAT superfamily N-acetyltransferase
MNNVLHDVVERNLRAAMRCYARVSASGESRDYPGVTVTSCGFDCAVFNSAMLNAHSRQAELRRVLSLADVHFRQRHLGWTFWLCEDMLPEAERKRSKSLLHEMRMECIAQPPGMYAEQLSPPARAAAPIEIRRVGDAATRLDFAHLSSLIFSLGSQTSKDIYGSAELWNGCMAGWVGYFESRPATLTAVVIAAGVAGVYSVGTLPDMQGRGFAETMMRHALKWAYETGGVNATVLQSTPQGMRLYGRLGYRVVTRFGVYLNEGNGLN